MPCEDAIDELKETKKRTVDQISTAEMEQSKKLLETGSKRLKIDEAKKIIDDYEKGLTPKPLEAPKAAVSEKKLDEEAPATVEPLNNVSPLHQSIPKSTDNKETDIKEGSQKTEEKEQVKEGAKAVTAEVKEATK